VRAELSHAGEKTKKAWTRKKYDSQLRKYHVRGGSSWDVTYDSYDKIRYDKLRKPTAWEVVAGWRMVQAGGVASGGGRRPAGAAGQAAGATCGGQRAAGGGGRRQEAGSKR
jgi:hypothetical protein